MQTSDPIEPLVALGLTELEAEIYACLVREAPATGYRVAQLIGKPVANTYKAIQSLARKGAALVDDGPGRQCRAVPPGELLARMDRRFREQRERAAAALAELSRTLDDDRVYPLRSVDQVMQRFRDMLARCTQVALVDIFPLPLSELAADIERATARGLRVAVKAYEPVRLTGAELAVAGDPGGVRARWHGQWCNLAIDGQEYLLAYLTPDGKALHQAVWSGSAYLSWVYHSALSSEWVLASLRNLADSGASAEAIREALAASKDVVAADAPGYLALAGRFGAPSDGDRNPA